MSSQHQLQTSGTTRVKKAATDSRQDNAGLKRDVQEHMSARDVKVLSRCTNVGSVIQTRSPFDVEYWASKLSNHPDQEYVDRILKYIREGVPVGYEGPRIGRVCKNWPSVQQFYPAVLANIENDLSKGRKAGPFSAPPFDTFVGSPMGAFEKRSSPGKYRIIHDLSWPPGHSVNDGISQLDCTVQYITVDDAVRRVKKYGPGTLMAKLDLEDAFKHIVVRPQDWDLLGSTLEVSDPMGTKTLQYFVDMVLPFGMRSSPKKFCEFADALRYMMEQNGVSDVDNYVDDFFTCGPPGTNQCEDNLNVMLDTCDGAKFSVAPRKIVWPAPVMEFLGIVIDSINMILCISESRLQDVLSELEKWSRKKTCTKRQLLSIIGKLTFVSKVVRPGRTFVRRMIEFSKKATALHHKIKLNVEFQKDVQWWLYYLPSWNGISLFYDEDWTTSADLCLYTDASNIGYGCYFAGHWFCEQFDEAKKACDILWRELYALLKAAATWGKYWMTKRVLFFCDNQAGVSILKSGSSRRADIMSLVRALFFVAAEYNFEFSAVYISTHDNGVADALSRFQSRRFHELAPGADLYMTAPVVVYYEGIDL